ncbi:MAG: GGDEF domain-containing protein [Candidatus Cloacimonadota bacterium]|nr:MAG: GGDEF domain-containing protein [Candidatus Cloacimonadota bacterium]PIE80825.1 MAG: GGDEF domain-containing protein [Candidatus Delongbacteria bacterium]
MNNLFVWNKDFETNLRDVDEQHKTLIEQVNILSENLLNDTLNFNDLENIFKKLIEYAVFHFSHEENLIENKQIYSKHVEEHKKSHNNFVEEVKFMYSDIYSDKFDIIKGKNLRDFLIHWLAFHILEEDKDLAEQIFLIDKGYTPKDAYNQITVKKDSRTKPLIKSLKGIMEVLTIRNRELRNLKESLEMKVKERTRELHIANKILEEKSTTDQLTKLKNRRYAMKILKLLWEESIEENSQLSTLIIDADHFKKVNDTCGHGAGDRVLKEISKTLKDSVRTDDIVCRLGGDEFLIICPKTDIKGGVLVANNILSSINNLKIPLRDNLYYNGSVSIGVASSIGLETVEDLIKKADKYVYIAKKDGKNCVRHENFLFI